MISNINSDHTFVFDLDDTLYKEIDYLKSAYTEIARNVSGQQWQATYAKMFALYREKKNVFDFITSQFDVEIDELLQLYRQHKPKIVLSDEVKGLLNSIKEKGAHIAVLTDGRSIGQRNKIEALGLEEWIEKAFISEELGSEKPSEKNFIAVEEYFNSTKYYYIGDNLKKDFITPNKRGWNTIGLIDNGLNIHVDSTNFEKSTHLPNHFLISLSELL
ncbi:HAD family hydrolase [Flavimarina sp. Hel_I_48]|uniref:HAD family hydrolase n=1 Tax=Flavimarina sp. Hel_I_48 TaxID=1392488 RepID=UPI0004DF296C|nr:HAD family hydrolase [Flavimarina sp. Hel_I_48]